MTMNSEDKNCTALILYKPIVLPGITVTNDSDFIDNDNGRKPFVGLSNQGATCYMNSLLQTLYMTPEFRRALYLWHYNPSKDGVEEFCIPLQLQRLFGKLQLSNQMSVDTVALTKSFGWEGSEVFQQQDVQELCRVLFDALEDTFKGTAVENIIDDLYAGELIDYVKCVDVDCESERRDKFLDFSLAIRPFGSQLTMHSLTECIEFYLQPEMMDGDNKYYAEKFDKKVDAIKGLKLSKLPTILSVQLKRFVYEQCGNNIVQKKVNEQVRFPLVLDMNKYVAIDKNKHNLDDNTDNEDSTATESNTFSSIHQNEFESFLQEKINLLKDRRNGILSTNDENELVDMYDTTLPDLLHYDGSKAPDQLKEADYQFPEELPPPDPIELLKTRGPWIYELFAVLIHAGAISGGHYYAYIRDLDSRKWWNFNDSVVTEIPESKVKEAWGGKIKRFNTAPTTANSNGSNTSYNAVDDITQLTSLWYGSSSSSSTSIQACMSSSNAYMLMYRRVTPDGGHVSFPADDLIPQYIREAITLQEEELAAWRRQEEIRINKLELKILWKEVEHSIHCSKKDTYRSLLLQLWEQLDLQHLPALSGVRSPEYNLRLRQYNSHLKIPQESYDVENQGDLTLKTLGYYDSKLLYLEIRAVGDSWEIFEKDGTNLVIFEYDANSSNSFKPQRIIRLPKTATLHDLRVRVAKFSTMDTHKIRFIKMTDASNYDAHCVELMGENKRIRDELCVYDMQKLYIEENIGPLSHSPSKAAYINSINKLFINFNRPEKVENIVFDQKIEVDRRWLLSRLRGEIASLLGIDSNSFVMHRQNIQGLEIKDTGQTLHSMSIYNETNIALSLGTPLLNGQYLLHISLYMTPYRPGLLHSSSHQSSSSSYPTSLTTQLLTDTTTGGESNNNNSSSSNNNIELTTMGLEGGLSLSIPSPYIVPSTKNLPLWKEEIEEGVEENKGEGSQNEDNDDDDNTTNSPQSLVTETEEQDLDTHVHGKEYPSKMSQSQLPLPPPSPPPLPTIVDTHKNDSDIESHFGELKVRTVSTDLFPQILKVVVESSTMIEVVRAQVAQKLIEEGVIPENSSPNVIRLREKSGVSVGMILRDGRSLRQSEITLYDGRVLAAQILESPEHLPYPMDGDVLVQVRRWHRSVWTLSETIEIYLSGVTPLNETARYLSNLFRIPYDNLRLLTLSPASDIYLSDLQYAHPPGVTQPWIDPTKILKPLNRMPWNLFDGSTILLQDCLEPLKILSPAEIKSVNDHRSANTSIYNYLQGLDSFPPPPPYPLTSATTYPLDRRHQQQYPYYSSNSSNSNNNSNIQVYSNPHGIRIKTHKDRQKELLEDAEREASSASSPTPVEDIGSLEGEPGGEDREELSNTGNTGPDGVFYSDYEESGNTALPVRLYSLNKKSLDLLQTSREDDLYRQSGGKSLFEDIC